MAAPSPLQDVLYGSTAGIVAKLVEHPFDLVKVRLQSQPLDRPLKYVGPLDCFVQTLRHEGLRALWRGVSMPVAGAMAENATLFVVFNQSQAFLARYSPPPPAALDAPPRLAITNMLISAALAGAAASFVLTPVELVKCKMQVQAIVASDALLASAASTVGYAAAGKVPVAPGEAISKSVKSPGPIAITRAILAADGLKGLWLGQTGTFIRETGGSAAWFTTFEVLISYHLHRRHARGERGPGERVVRKGDLTAWELMSSGAAAGVIYNTVLFPADCIKSTIQTEDELRGLTKGGAVGRRSFMTVGKDIYRARGLAGLYQGCGLTALRAAPSSALIFYIYSKLESYFA